jgi:hypothetical protein
MPLGLSAASAPAHVGISCAPGYAPFFIRQVRLKLAERSRLSGGPDRADRFSVQLALPRWPAPDQQRAHQQGEYGIADICQGRGRELAGVKTRRRGQAQAAWGLGLAGPDRH